MSVAYLQTVGGPVRLYSHQRVSGPPLPPPNYDVIVGLIQSNIRGVASFEPADQYDSSVYMWNWLGQQMVRASEPLSTQDATGGMGAMNTFIKDYQAESLEPNRRILVVNTARGGTGFATPSTNPAGTLFSWDRTRPNDSNNLARVAVAELKKIMALLSPESRIVAYLANHGSTDGTQNMPKATFKALLQDWIGYLRSELATPNVPYVMMQMRPNLINDETRHRIIAEAQAETAAELPDVGYALSPSGSLYYANDPVHFNAAGMRFIGHSLHDKFLTLV